MIYEDQGMGGTASVLDGLEKLVNDLSTQIEETGYVDPAIVITNKIAEEGKISIEKHKRVAVKGKRDPREAD